MTGARREPLSVDAARRRVADLSRALACAREQLVDLPEGRLRLMRTWAEGLVERVQADDQSTVFDEATVSTLRTLQGKDRNLPLVIDSLEDRLACAVVEYVDAQVADLSSRLGAGEPVQAQLGAWRGARTLLDAQPGEIVQDIIDRACRGEDARGLGSHPEH